MAVNQKIGIKGEKDVVRLVSCPNCKKKLMFLPPNFPLYDVQCTGCSFRAQIKTIQSKPKGIFFGAGWAVIDKVLKSGYMIPPLIANFQWIDKGRQKREIRFFPFIPKVNLRKYQLSSSARRANYKMFLYSKRVNAILSWK